MQKKNYEKDFNKGLNKKITIIYKLRNKDINKFILLFRKGIYPYEYMDSWKRFDETLLPNIEDFYSSLNMEDIADVDYRHERKAYKEFKINNLGDYHNLYV